MAEKFKFLSVPPTTTDPAAHPRASQGNSGVTQRFREALMDSQQVRRLLAVLVRGWIPTDDSPYLPPHLPPGSGERGVTLPQREQ
jgi:hypothetical protein